MESPGCVQGDGLQSIQDSARACTVAQAEQAALSSQSRAEWWDGGPHGPRGAQPLFRQVITPGCPVLRTEHARRFMPTSICMQCSVPSLTLPSHQTRNGLCSLRARADPGLTVRLCCRPRLGTAVGVGVSEHVRKFVCSLAPCMRVARALMAGSAGGELYHAIQPS